MATVGHRTTLALRTRIGWCDAMVEAASHAMQMRCDDAMTSPLARLRDLVWQALTWAMPVALKRMRAQRAMAELQRRSGRYFPGSRITSMKTASFCFPPTDRPGGGA